MEREQQNLKFGLQPLKDDKRDFQLGMIFNLPDLSELPEDFSFEVKRIKDQAESDFCSAFASCGLSELQEDVELNPIFSFAASKELSGDPEAWGQNLRDAVKAHVEYGALAESESEHKTKDSLGDYSLRKFENWSDTAKNKALIHKKQSYASISGKYDAFDNIRTSIWKFRKEEKAVLVGVLWGWSLRDKIITLENSKQALYGHAMYVVGWKKIEGENYLIVVNSYGESAGDHGVHYISRTAINSFVQRFGAFIVTDMPRETAEYYIQNGIMETDFWFVKIWREFINLIKALKI